MPSVLIAKRRMHAKCTQSNSLGLTTETANLVLMTLKDASRLAPTPYLQDAALLALAISTAIQVRRQLFDGIRYSD